MTNGEKIISYLKNNNGKYCDDCLSKELLIEPRQTVNSECRFLNQKGIINRTEDVCSSCTKNKNVNSLRQEDINKIEYTIQTNKLSEMIDITNIIRGEVKSRNINEGIITIFIPHTTAGITINENADPDVVYDILNGLNKAFPENGEYRHAEGNSHAHIKASLMGSSCSIIIENGELKLGTWQGVYFCEFDGPRTRKVFIKIMGI